MFAQVAGSPTPAHNGPPERIAVCRTEDATPPHGHAQWFTPGPCQQASWNVLRCGRVGEGRGGAVGRAGSRAASGAPSPQSCSLSNRRHAASELESGSSAPPTAEKVLGEVGCVQSQPVPYGSTSVGVVKPSDTGRVVPVQNQTVRGGSNNHRVTVVSWSC